MVVYSKENFIKALKSGEERIELQSKYAEEVMKKYNQYLMSAQESINPLIMGIIPQKMCFPLLKPLWVEFLRYYEVESYAKDKLVINRVKVDIGK